MSSRNSLTIAGLALLLLTALAGKAAGEQFGDLVAVVAVVVVVAYYLRAWWLVGRDSPRDTITPLYEPPQNISPAAVRFVVRQGFDFKCFLVALLSLDSKGFVTIQRTGHVYQLTRTAVGESVLFPDEQHMVRRLFDDTRLIKFEDNYRVWIAEAIDALRARLRFDCEGTQFQSNTERLRGGVILSLAAIAAVGRSAVFTLVVLGALMLVSLFVAYMTALLWTGWVQELAARQKPVGSSMGAVPLLLMFTAVAAAIAAGTLALLCLAWLPEIVRALLVTIALVLAHVFFYNLLKAPTPAGRRLLDRIEGFRMFLAATEQDQLERLVPPDKVPELVNRLLPYVVALDLENHWAERLGDVISASNLTAVQLAGVYSGVNWFGMDPVGFLGWAVGRLRDILTLPPPVVVS